ncbi:MAG: 4-hydroxy-tetrahydrodipicolinate reductase [Phycisphaerales bacterium]
MSTPHIIVHGASGRMGRRIIALAAPDHTLKLMGAIVRDGAACIAASASENMVFSTWKTPLSSALIGPTVVIDFSSPAGASAALSIAREARAALLVGTTGLDEIIVEKLREASRERAVLLAPNTSRGVAVCADAVRRIATLLGPAYACAIVEAHHDQKKDAPSGTAKRLASAAREGGARLSDGQILALRGGDVIGEHTIRFAGPGEYIEITHRATTRDLFALGAIGAARWLCAQPPGWYTIEDVVGMRR